jgi:hypothetical protein
MRGFIGLGREVEKWQQKDPDYVDQVPVKARVFQFDEIIVANFVARKEHHHH